MNIIYFFIVFPLIFFSWIFGMLLYALIRNTEFHKRQLSNLNFVKSEYLNRMFGLGLFKWVVKNTAFKLFNPKLNLKLQRRVQVRDLHYLRAEMLSAEISHLIAFMLLCIAAIVVSVIYSFLFGCLIMVFNIFMNLYPALLQQQNKRRIARYIGSVST